MKLPNFFISILLLIISCGRENQNANHEKNSKDLLSEQMQSDSLLRKNILKIINSYKAQTGAAVMDLQTGDTITFFNQKHYPMQSVFKFPLGMAVLDRVDRKQLSLDQKINLDKSDMHKNTYSPLRDKYPDGAEIPLSEILDYTVSKSDNNGCDKLFRIIGGPDSADAYIKSIGINEIKISADENAMHHDETVQFTNWSTPYGMIQLLNIADKGSKLSESSNDFLTKMMRETPTGPKRIRGLLPEGTIVAHKTGSSGMNDKGITDATNDVGIVTLPNGKKYAVVVFVSNSTETDEVNENIIAQISKTAYDYYLEKYK